MNAIKKIVMGLAVACAMAVLPAMADGVSISSAEGAITVTVPANAVEETAAVYLAWDTEDKGDTFADWTNKEELGDVTAAGDTFEVQGATHSIPNGAKIRAFVRGTSDEVEYLAATANSWVDTGIIGQYGDVYEIDFMMLEGTGANVFVVGSCDNTSTGRFAPLHYYNGGFQQDVNDAAGTLGLSADGRSNTAGSVSGLVPFPLGKRYRAVSTLTSGARKLSIEEVGGTLSVESTTWNYTTAIANTKYSLYLFTRNQTGSVNTANAARCRIYGFKVTRGGDVIQDLVPKATGFYDKVTKDMLDGSTTLVAGPAVVSTVAVSSAATYSEGGEEPPTPVEPTVVTVTPNANQSKTVGAADPTLTYTLSQTIAVEGALARAAGETVGTYAINLGTLKAADESAYTLELAATPVNFEIKATEPEPPEPTGGVEVSSAAGAITVTVAADTVAESTPVYLAWDTADKGDTLSAWAHSVKIGDVDANGGAFGADGVELNIDDGAVLKVFVAKDGIKFYPALTKPAATQGLVVTDYFPNHAKTKRIELDAKFGSTWNSSASCTVAGSQVDNGNLAVSFGVENVSGSTVTSRFRMNWQSTGNPNFYTWSYPANPGSGVSMLKTSFVNPGYDTRGTLKITTTATSWKTASKTVDGTIPAQDPYDSTVDFADPFGIFGFVQNIDGARYTVPMLRRDMTVYAFRAYENDTAEPAANYVPAEKDGEKGLYNTVSGTFCPATIASGFAFEGDVTNVIVGVTIPSSVSIYDAPTSVAMTARVTGMTGPADGTAYSCTLTVENPATGWTAKWWNGSDYTLDAAPTHTAEGVYEDSVKIVRAGYLDFYGTGVVTVTEYVPPMTAQVEGAFGRAFDSTTYACKLTVTEPASGWTAKWYNPATEDFDLAVAPEYDAVGDYTNVVKVTAAGYQDFYGTGVVTVVTTPVQQEIQLKDQLDSILEKSAAHYLALDAAATPSISSAKPIPRSFNGSSLVMWAKTDWTAGFFGGSLWYLYEATGNTQFRDRAIAWTEILESNKTRDNTHDVGFIMYCSYGNARRILDTDEYDDILLTTATSLCKRYNPTVGCIRSWGSIGDMSNFQVIPDNLMNLELLEWAAKNGGGAEKDEIAQSHATTTARNHYRADYGCYHVVNYNPNTGAVTSYGAGQGKGTTTAWARGQSWSIYGYTMMYRETGVREYLDQAVHCADFAINNVNMPSDGIPYWDYGAPGEERDSSAGAIMASALLELANYVPSEKCAEYRAFATKQLLALASSGYYAEQGENGDFLLKHGVGSKPGNSEVDVPLVYGDYYFLEALLRFKSEANTWGEFEPPVEPTVVTVTPDAGQAKTVGAADPTLTYTLSQTIAVEGALARAAGETVGTYAINLGTLVAANPTAYTLQLAAEAVYFSITNAVTPPTPPEPPTGDVEISSANGTITVTVPADTVEETAAVYLVWDTTNKGDTFADWTNKEELGDVTAVGGVFNVTGATLGIPNGAVIRAFVGGRVQFYESLSKPAAVVGAVQTDYCPDKDKTTGFEIRMTPGATFTTGSHTGLLGIYETLAGTTVNRFGLGCQSKGDAAFYAWLYPVTSTTQSDLRYAYNLTGKSFSTGVSTVRAVNSETGTWIDGNWSVNATTSTPNFSQKVTYAEQMSVFGSTVIAQETDEATILPFTGRDLTVYSLKVFEGASVAAEFVPAEKDGVKGLYNTVSGAFCPATADTGFSFGGTSIGSIFAANMASSAATYSAGGEEPPTPPTPTVVTVTPNANQAKTIGAADPTLTYTLSQNIAVTGALARVTGEDVGEYAITLGTLGAANPSAYTLVLAATPVNFEIKAAEPEPPEPPEPGEGIAVTSSAGTITVTVDAGTVASPSDLILAWDTEDRGAVLGDWAHSARIATGVTAEGAVVNVTGLSLGITAGMKVRAFLGGESVQFYESLTKPKAVAAAVMTDYRPVFGQMTGFDCTVQLGDAFTSGTSFFFGIRAFASGSETARLTLNCQSTGNPNCYASTYPESTSAALCDKFSFANTGNFTKKGTFRIRPNTSTWSGDSWTATVTKPADTFAPASFDANLAVFGYTKVDGLTVTLDPFTCRDLTVFGLKIYEGSAVAAEYVPAEKNGEYGLFNVSNGNFCPASAAGLQPGERTVMHIPTVIGLTESADYVPGGDDPLAPMTASVAGGAWLADGQPHAATLTVTVPATGWTAKWAWHGEDAFTHDDPQACTAAGIYTNRVQVTADDFETFTGTAVVTLVDPAAGIAPMTRTRYLEAMNRIVSLYTDDILASILATARSKGVTEHGFPRLTSDLGVLIANGYQTSRKDAFIEMMDICCQSVPTKTGIANNFSVSELVFCLRQIEHANIVTTEKFAEWKSALSGSIAYDSLGDVGKQTSNNWIVYATASEQARAGFGMNGDTAKVETWASDQLRFFIDGEWNDQGAYSILYDLITRLQYASALYHGYDGASAAQLIAHLEAGTDSFLEMQAATGEMAAGGRSQSYVMNEGIMAALAEWYAQHYAAKGDVMRAMRFRGAAVRAMEAMEGYLSRDIISHTKNNYPITSFSGTSKGCESYGYFDKYMTTAASWLCLAIDFLDAAQQPTMALEPLPEPTVHVMPAGFHQTMVTAGGYTAQFDSNANSQYDVKGLVRIVRRGVPSPMALMFGLPKSPNYSIDLTNPSNLAVVPMYWNGTGWKGYVDSTGATATYTLAEQSATADSATVVWNVTHTSYPAVRMTVTVSAGGVSVKVENTDGTSRIGLRMPVFAFDGANNMTISATGTQVATTDADGNAATWRVESANGSVESADQVFANRNGHYNLYNACANDAGPLTVRVILTQPGEEPPGPGIKRGLILFGSPAEK